MSNQTETAVNPLFCPAVGVKRENMNISIRQNVGSRKQFDPYWYEILDGEQVIASYWHDYRGDDHGIKFMDGTEDSWPVGCMTEFLLGGGPHPLKLSEKALTYLMDRLQTNQKA